MGKSPTGHTQAIIFWALVTTGLSLFFLLLAHQQHPDACEMQLLGVA